MTTMSCQPPAMVPLLTILLGVLWPLIVAGDSSLTDTEPEMKEYCQWEKFNASCGQDEVIIMHTARYGRMQLGRCLTTDYFVGCSADVLSHVDSKCSGRQNCVITIPDPTLFNVQPCRKDLVAYFSASYYCIKVQTGEGQRCVGEKSTSLPPSGYLASFVTEQSTLGSKHCPWIIHVSPGQSVNISLYDFSTWPAPSHSDVHGPAAKACTIVGNIEDGLKMSEIRTCYGYQRITHVYTSTNNIVRVEIVNPAVARRKVYFLLKYEATGCANLRAHKHVTVERQGDVAKVKCNETAKTWHLVCKGTTWMGEIGNCTESFEAGKKSTQILDIPEHIPYGIMIAIGIGAVLGVLLGIVFLTTVLVCQKRRRQARRQAAAREVCPPCEGHYADHPEVAYKLMELREQGLTTIHSRNSLGAEDLTTFPTYQRHKPPGMRIYDRAIPELGAKIDAYPIRTEIPDTEQCLGCSREKEKCYLFDLVHPPKSQGAPPKSYNSNEVIDMTRNPSLDT